MEHINRELFVSRWGEEERIFSKVNCYEYSALCFKFLDV